MTISKEVLSQYVRKEKYDKALFFETVQQLIKVVLMKHFNNHMYDQDLVSAGTTKVFELLHSTFVDPNHNLVNFLYTSIRNEIGNIIKREKRISESTESLNDRPFYNDNFQTGDSFRLSRRIEAYLVRIADNFLYFDITVQDDIAFYSTNFRSLGYYGKFALRAATARMLAQ